MVQTDFERGLQLGLFGYVPSEPHEFTTAEGEKNSAIPYQFVVFCYDSIERETDKAFLLVRGGLKYWMPKSKIFNETIDGLKEFDNVKYFVTGNFLFGALTPI